MKRITIDPVTRLEGHAKIDIFLDAEGEVANTYFQVPELRGFESFCVGRQVEEMPVITNRICGVCPEAHHMAAVKALDDLFGVEPPSVAKKVRELLYMAFFITDHTTHFYALGGPDFVVGMDAPPAERNLLGVIRKVGLEVGKKVMACRARNHHVIQMLGGRGIHPAAGVPGGWSKAVNEAERLEIEAIARANIEFAHFTLKVFDDIVLNNKTFMELVTSDLYLHRTYSMGTVDARGQVNFYDGQIRVVDPDGLQFVHYDPKCYMDHLAEHLEPWSYLKFPYLKKIGWNGFVDGKQSGVYTASPLSRLNVSNGMPTPQAQEEFERFYATFGAGTLDQGRRQPIHHRLATHWARLIELLYASERMLELATDPEITDPRIRIPVQTDQIRGVGIGSVEAPRGTLTHHYETDSRGILTRVNLIVGTTNNYAPIAMSTTRAARGLIKKGKVVDQGLLNRIEMAFRLYDPCFSCATHALPGNMPMVVRLIDVEGKVVDTLRRDS
ncbi:MAG: Ni/Fe hydrogenase subunit alpha [Magnetococcales bacterium]|nr:Ni/Fe hydrogenase subunit alpha [Magnetococcales bacterium]MBF0150786.1 Ni/Fe hydrogenase subunit alpha [Magnetococcales bacterium]MBF0631884.1 Ni/Fe hydrogenase subunit alpha [Magnetococcales bacterium]